jgi:hypothetical protein
MEASTPLRTGQHLVAGYRFRSASPARQSYGATGSSDPSPISVPVLMRELGNKSQRGVSEGGA